ncbi:MAG: DUF1476 domain-containing protein [Alphaproteobacteria bacterium]
MNQFSDREKAFESKFAHDEELQFKVGARRNKLLGLWAAEIMGLSDDDAAEYAKEVVKADFEEAGHEDVYRKVKGDLDAKHLDISEHRVRKAMDDLLAEARNQVMNEVS